MNAKEVETHERVKLKRLWTDEGLYYTGQGRSGWLVLVMHCKLFDSNHFLRADFDSIRVQERT
jgi:hypothetical protein